MQSPIHAKDAFDPILDQCAPVLVGFNDFAGDLFSSLDADADVEPQPFDLPNIFDDLLLDFPSLSSTSHIAPSLVMADTETASWSRVRDFVNRNPTAARPGLGFHASLLGADVQPQPLLVDGSLISSDSPVRTEAILRTLGVSSTPTSNFSDAKAVQEPRRLAIPPGTSSGWSDAFKEFACGNTW